MRARVRVSGSLNWRVQSHTITLRETVASILTANYALILTLSYDCPLKNLIGKRKTDVWFPLLDGVASKARVLISTCRLLFECIRLASLFCSS